MSEVVDSDKKKQRNVIFQPSFCCFKIRSKDHDDSGASGAINQSNVERLMFM